MIEGRVLVQRIHSAKVPADLRPFDKSFAVLCLDLADAAYRLLPDAKYEPEMDLAALGGQLTGAQRDELRSLLGSPDASLRDERRGLVFAYDGAFIKALGYRVRNAVIVAIRGTSDCADYMIDANARTTRVTLHSALTSSMEWMVHRGFHSLTMQIKEPVERELAQVCDRGDRIVVTGHSLGGAVGLLLGAAFDDSGITGSDRTHLSVEHAAVLSSLRIASHYSFGAPRPGRNISSTGFPHHRLVAPGDWIPRLSPLHSHDVDPIPLWTDGAGQLALPWRERLDPLRYHRLANYRTLLSSLP